MDWASLYPAYAVKIREHGTGEALIEENEEEQRQRFAISKNVEIADIGCGFGGLLFALAPELLDTLILGKKSIEIAAMCVPSRRTSLIITQAWKSALRSQNTCKKRYAHYVSRMLPQTATRTSLASVPTQ